MGAKVVGVAARRVIVPPLAGASTTQLYSRATERGLTREAPLTSIVVEEIH